MSAPLQLRPRPRPAARTAKAAAFGLIGLACLPGAASAAVLTFSLTPSSDVVGAASGSPSAFCSSGSTCPGGSPAFPLSASEPLTGTISVDTTASTLTFDLTLAQNAAFGALTLDAGSTLTSGPISVSISSSTKGGVTTDTILPGSGTFSATASLLLSSGFTQTLGAPIISGLDCSLTVGAGGSCAFVLGTPVNGSDALAVDDGNNAYDGVLSISTNLTPVPLPSSAWLLLAGLAALILARPRARLARVL